MGDIAAGAGPDDDEDLSTVGDEAIGEDEQFLGDDDTSAYITMVSAVGIVGDRRNLLLPPALRNRDQRDPFWNTAEGRDVLASASEPSLVLKALTDLVTTVSDANTVECLKKNFDDVRGTFERSKPQVQCGNTIGAVVDGVTPCWICGVPIISNHMAVTTAQLGPECEHVFPVAQALCFTGLYETQMFKQIQDLPFGDGTMGDAYITGVRLEYDWAHRICNQVKSDTHFIRYVDNTFVIDPAAIRVFLDSILVTPSWGTGTALQAHLKNVLGMGDGWYASWLPARIQAIQARCEQLIIAASTTGLTPDELARVTIMSMRSFIVSTGLCTAMREEIPKLKGFGPGGATFERTFRVPTLDEIPMLSSKDPVAVANFALGKGIEKVTGLFDDFVDNLPRTYRPDARMRGKVIAYALDGGQFWRRTRTGMIEDFAKLQRDKIAYGLISGNNITSDTPYETARSIWSTIQTWSTIVIQTAIYEIIAENLFKEVADEGAGEAAGVFKEIINMPAFDAIVKEWAASKVTQTKDVFMIPYEAIAKTEVVGTDWKPRWYLDGGLRKRRPLYSNAATLTRRV